jgi:hypothetical protein
MTTLNESGALEILPGVHWGQQSSHTISIASKRVLVIHNFVWDGKNLPWKDCNKTTAEELLDKYPDCDLILTGDHHKGFIYKKGSRLLVNPGCFTVQSAGYMDYDPKVYLWYANDNNVYPVDVPNNKKMITREHLDIQQDRENKLEQFVQNVKKEWKEHFGNNMDDPKKFLEQYFMKNQIEKQIQQIIFNAVETADIEENSKINNYE